MIIFFNLSGLGMMGASVGAGFAATHLLNLPDETPAFYFAAGSVALIADGLVRSQSDSGHWLSPTGGGHFLFIPVWVFGLLWLLIGGARAIMGERSAVVDGVIVAGVVIAILGVGIYRASQTDSELAAGGSTGAAEWECPKCSRWNAGNFRFCKHCQTEKVG
ncbi:MAG: hypothetical protein K2R98_10865 [Gemmataceae bacterium]|nr:hypothetical protein [Gemmataceae bacterium]